MSGRTGLNSTGVVAKERKRDGENVSESLRGSQAVGVVSLLVFSRRFFSFIVCFFDKISKTFQVGAAHVRAFQFVFFFLGCLCFFCFFV